MACATAAHDERHMRIGRSAAGTDATKRKIAAILALAPQPAQPEVDTDSAHPHDGEDSLLAASDEPAQEGGCRGLGRKLDSFADLHAFDAP